MSWFVYIVKGSDDSLYTGISNNVEKRIETHNRGKGSKSLRGKLPVSLAYSELYNSRTEALVREAEIKSWDRKKKLILISGR
jgi:putative endonuclease